MEQHQEEVLNKLRESKRAFLILKFSEQNCEFINQSIDQLKEELDNIYQAYFRTTDEYNRDVTRYQQEIQVVDRVYICKYNQTFLMVKISQIMFLFLRNKEPKMLQLNKNQ